MPGSVGQVYDVIADIAGYPTWWPQVRAIAKVDDSTARIVIRSFLPYSLECELESVVQDRAAGILEARLRGDIDGWSRWTLTQDGDQTTMHFEQVVDTPHWPLRAALWMRWLPEFNHEWMMKRGEIALRRHLAEMGIN